MSYHPKLMTEHRWNVLVQMVEDNGSGPPWGYKRAGAHASHWWSAVAWLREHGYAEKNDGYRRSRTVRATEKGLQAVREWRECAEPIAVGRLP